MVITTTAERLMRTEAPLLSSILVSFLVGACASTSISSDLEVVHHFVGAAPLPDLEDTPRDEVKALLARPLDAEGAVKIALLNNRELRARLHELGISRGRLIEAGTVANPEIEAELLPERETSLELRVEYDLSSLVLAPLRARAAESALEAERHRVAGELIQLGFEVRSAFYALQADQQRFEIAKQAIETYALARDTASSMRAAGNIPALAYAQTITAHEQARVLTAELELAVFLRREELQRRLGLHGLDTTWTSSPRLARPSDPLPPFEDIERRALESSHELAALRHALETASEQTAVTRTEGWLLGLHVDVHALLGRPEDGPGTGDASSWRLGAGLSLEVPLFDRKQGRLVAREAELSALFERRQGVAIELRSATREAAARLRFAHARVTRYDGTILPAQAAQTEEALLQYNGMQLDVFALLEHRRSRFDQELASVDALLDYWQTRAALDALLAGRRVSFAEDAGPNLGTSGARPNGGH
jgi:outer membrane protein TolC